MSARIASTGFGGALVRMSAPVIIWAVHFLAIYAFTAIACARGFAATRVLGVEVVSWGIAVATLGAGGAMVFIIATAARRRRKTDETDAFVRWIGAAAAGLALVGIVWEALPVLFVPVCR